MRARDHMKDSMQALAHFLLDTFCKVHLQDNTLATIQNYIKASIKRTIVQITTERMRDTTMQRILGTIIKII